MGYKALLISVNKTQVKSFDPLPKAKTDIRAIECILQNSTFPYQIEVIADERATSEHIKRSLRCLLKNCEDVDFGKCKNKECESNSENDIYFIFWAGHGTSLGELVTYDGKIAGADMRELIKEFKENSLLAVFDCCYGGGVTYNARGDSSNLKFDMYGTGNIIITSCSSTQIAWDGVFDDHSVFAYYFIDALSGKALDVEGNVTICSLYSYVSRKIKQSSEKNGHELQTPTLDMSVEGDFIINRLANNEYESGISKSSVNVANFITRSNNRLSQIAVKSFVEHTQHLENKDIETLDVSEYFESGKFIKNESNWSEINNKIEHFCTSKENQDIIYYIHLNCSYSISFLVGRAMNPKSGICAYPVQKTLKGKEFWETTNANNKSFEDFCTFDIKTVDETASNDALIISITHNVEMEVMEYASEQPLLFKNIYSVKSKNIGHEAINNGMQCWSIASFIAKVMGSRTRKEKISETHVFISAPVSVFYSIGKLSLNMGKMAIYEHDFNRTKKTAYIKSIVVD